MQLGVDWPRSPCAWASAARGDELAAQDDYSGEAVWRRITDAVHQLANQTPAGPLHRPRTLWPAGRFL
jgi:hypothetical protein